MGSRSRRKREKREERKMQKEEERRQHKKRQRLRNWAMAGGAVILLVIAAYLLSRPPDTTGKGVLELATKLYDFGAVSVAAGTVEAEIALVNTGEGKLTIIKLDSSCGCTSASVTNNGKEGPVFQMSAHGKNPGAGARSSRQAGRQC